jgi:hypothetical protein
VQKKLSTVLLTAVCLAGCNVPPPKPPLLETVAILPFDNYSNDVNAPDIMQRLTFLALKNSPYRISDVIETNERLAKVGIVDGGQLPAVDPTKVGKEFGVQALLYGDVENFSYTNIGFYLQKRVTLHLKMVDVNTGATLWEGTGNGITRDVNLDKHSATRACTSGLAEQLVDKVFKTPLQEEAEAATIRALYTLPGYNFTGFARDDKSPDKWQRPAKNMIKDQIKK